MSDPEPLTASDGEVLGYTCGECGTMVKTESKAVAHCTDDADTRADGGADVEAASTDANPGFDAGESPSRGDVRDHHRRISDAVAPLGTLGDNPTILVADKKRWYVTRDNATPTEDEIGEWPKERRPHEFARDYGHIVADKLDRSVYALTSYKRGEAFERWTPARFDDDKERYDYPDDNPMPTAADTAAVAAWGDIDLADELKPERSDLDADTYATAEAALEAYIDAFADLYGGRDAVYALDSVGGAYVFGAPEATLPIARYYEDDDDARERVLSAFIERSNDYLGAAEERINDSVTDASDVLHPDWANNVNRQYKMPLTLHSDHDAVVTPIDTDAVRYREPVSVESVDDALTEQTREWCEGFTANDHEDRVTDIVAALWPDEYDEHGDWQAALDAWVDAERERECEERRQRQRAIARREQRREAFDGDLGGVPIVSEQTAVYDALDAIDTGGVIRLYACDEWDTGDGSKTEFDPSWRTSSSGRSCFINESDNTFGDPGDGGGGHATKAMALGEGIITDASDDLDGEQWAEAVDALREAGYEIPILTPGAGSENADGEPYEEMPFWAVRKAAVALGEFPEDGFIEKTDDDGNTYPGFPGAKTYNNALDAIEDAEIEHGRERADITPELPTYALFDDDADYQLVLVPKNGTEATLTIEHSGARIYSETINRGAWESGHKRGRIAGRVGDELGERDDLDAEEVKSATKSALVSADGDSGEDGFTDALRSPRERELRHRTESVDYYPRGDGAEWVVKMSASEDAPTTGERRMTFDAGAMRNQNPGAFQTIHLAQFGAKIDLDSGEWSNITDYWLEVQTVREWEADPHERAAIETFVSKTKKAEVWEDEDGFDWDSRNGLFIEDYADGRDAVLLPGRWVAEWKQGNDYNDINLSRLLRENDIMLGATSEKYIAGAQNSVWPIAADELGVTYGKQVADADDDSDDSDKPGRML